jgi:uncharacterized protein (DUF1697 family)
MTFVALFRAINVSGQNRISMGDLSVLLEGLGLRGVRTYLQSGNAVFDADADSTQELATAIEVRIERDLGPRVGVLVLPADALAAVVAVNPFVGANGAAGPGHDASASDESWLHATFLFGAHGESDFGEASEAAYSAVYEAAFRRLQLPAVEGEEAAFVGVPPLAAPVVYLKLPHGYGHTKLTNAYFERKLGTATTTRSWRTVGALAGMAADS